MSPIVSVMSASGARGRVPAPPVSGGGGGAFTPNLPAGLVAQFDTTLHELGTSPGSTPGGLYFSSFIANGGSIVSTPDAPHAPTSFRMQFAAGDVGGAGGPAILAGTSGNLWQQLYLAIAVRFSANYVVHSNEEKFFYPRMGNGTINTSPAASNFAIIAAGNPATGNIGWNMRSIRPDGGGTNVFSEPFLSPPFPQRGAWHTIEMFMQMNAPNSYNGILRTWIDGVPQVNRTDVRFHGESVECYWNELLFDGTRGGGADGGSAVPVGGMTRDYNRLAVYTSATR